MGTINFHTGDFITMCNEPFDPFKYTEEGYEDDMEALYKDVKAILNRETFNDGYFKVTLDYGYYEGFSVTVDEGDYSYYDDLTEKKEAYDAVKGLQKCLEMIADVGMISCYPGWCMGYDFSYKATKRAIRKAMAKLRVYIQSVPTYRTYKRRLENAVSY